MRLIIAIILILTLSSCGKFRIFDKSSQVKQPLSNAYATGNLKVRVFYEPGAEPYTEVVVPGLPTPVKAFTVLDKNIKAMFPGKTVTVPMELAQMSAMSVKNETVWTTQEIHDLGVSLGEASSGDTTVFNVFFLNGHAENQYVIGLHLSNTNTIAIFKEVVKSSGSGTVQKYVEQATLVHEVGHAVGLVNNPLPMITPHEDTAHRAHCINPKCVMYYMNEGAGAMATFIQGRMTNPDLVMLDDKCLKDVTSHK
jgi:predicted Zn-dependent protease